jgi:hypothetical protein
MLQATLSETFRALEFPARLQELLKSLPDEDGDTTAQTPHQDDIQNTPSLSVGDDPRAPAGHPPRT